MAACRTILLLLLAAAQASSAKVQSRTVAVWSAPPPPPPPVTSSTQVQSRTVALRPTPAPAPVRSKRQLTARAKATTTTSLTGRASKQVVPASRAVLVRPGVTANANGRRGRLSQRAGRGRWLGGDGKGTVTLRLKVTVPKVELPNAEPMKHAVVAAASGCALVGGTVRDTVGDAATALGLTTSTHAAQVP